jgi:Cu-Zn family superoxide dismutase
MKIRTLALVLPLTALTACTNAIEVSPRSSATATASAWTIYSSASPPPASSATLAPSTEAAGTFLPYRPGSAAITYDPAVVPPGATAKLTITKTGYGTEVRLTATGLIPHRAYGAHLHTNPCTAIPDEAGPHYQNHRDPVTPSVNPVYANPQNEVWLDFTADTTGAGVSTSAHGWDFDPKSPPRSLVLHAEPTRTAPGEAGKAGPRAACLTLPSA